MELEQQLNDFLKVRFENGQIDFLQKSGAEARACFQLHPPFI
jgi:hypothetical protein